MKPTITTIRNLITAVRALDSDSREDLYHQCVGGACRKESKPHESQLYVALARFIRYGD